MKNILKILKNSSKRRLLIMLFSLLMLIIASFVYLYFPEKFKETVLQSTIVKAGAIADMAAINVGSALYFEDMENAEIAIKSFKDVTNIVNVIIFKTNYQPLLVVNLDTTIVYEMKLDVFQSSGFSNDNEFYTMVKPINFNKKKIGYISVCLSLEDINNQVNHSKRIITIISLIMFLFGLTGVLLISMVFVKPLDNLVSTFLKISNGDLSSRVDVNTTDEFGKLGKYFNNMVDQVEITQKKLFEMNIALEEKVEERTIDLKNEIEERKKAEVILRESEERIRNIFENAPFGIYQTTLEGKILFANPALVKMLKFETLDLLLERDISKTGFINDSDRNFFLDKIIKEERIYNYHTQWMANDGSIIFISENARLVKDDFGKIKYIEGMVEDITERMKVEEKLRENEEKYRNIFEKFQDVYFKIDLNAIFIDLSPSVFSFSGYEVSELIGKPIDTVYYERINNYEFFKKLLDEKKIVNFESIMRRKDGELVNVNMNTQLEFDDNGNPEFITGTLHDISYLKKIENELIELNATKDKFFSIIAHDLRNPISSFKQVTDVLLNDFDNLSENDKKEFVHSLDSSAKQLFNLLENLLTWSSSQRGKIPYNPDIADIHPIIMNNITLMDLQAGNKEITFKTESKDQNFGFYDINMINTVLRNLISNAIKFTNRNGTITIGSQIKNNELIVWVKDTGVGMSKEVVSSLFKIGSGHTTKGTADEKGTGLGLVLCKELVEKNNGRIWVESELGVGTKFIFALPVEKKVINGK